MPNKFDTNQWIRSWSEKKEMTPLPERSKPKESSSDPNEQNWFTRAMITSMIAENPSVAAANGYRIKPNGDVVQEDTPESRQLAKNLAMIGEAGATGMALPYVVGAATNPINIETAKVVGKNLLQGAFDYTLADGAARAVTGKDIMTNVNDGVKYVFGDNKYTNFATQYVTPFAPIPVFGTGNFGKYTMSMGKNILNGVYSKLSNAKSMINNFRDGVYVFNLPKNNNWFYRQVGDEAINDAISTGVIRANPNAVTGAGNKLNYIGPSFKKGDVYNPYSNDNVIVWNGKGNIDWAEIRPHSSNDINIDINKSSNIPIGSEATPVFNDITDFSPASNFIYYKRPNGLLGKYIWQKHEFPISKTNFGDNKVDTEYFKAIFNGNMEEAQRLRDLHFINNTPGNKMVVDGEPIKAYHGTPHKFTVFNSDLSPSGKKDTGYYGQGNYFTPDKDYAKGYASVGYNGDRDGIVMENYLYSKKPIETVMEDLSLEGKKLLNNDGVIVRLGDGDINLDDVKYDPNEIMELMVPNSNQIKSAAAVTYDDAGNIIPLSKRDDFTNPDIRYAIAPLIGLSVLGKTKQAE